MTPENATERQAAIRLSRRQLLKTAVLALAGLSGLAERQKDDLPDDLLTPEELQKTHIKIYQTATTRLYLRPGAFEIPLFKEARDAKLDQVVIVLVDSQNLNFTASLKLPPDARLAWQALNGPEAVLADYLGILNFLEQTGAASQPGIGQNNYNQIKKEVERLKEDPTKWLDEVYQNRIGETIIGHILALKNPQFLKNHPQFATRVYVYLAVGGDLKPSPHSSYPNPREFKKHDSSQNPSDYRFQFDFARRYRGFILRHETCHWDPNLGYLPEYEADTCAFNSLVAAWQKYQETGDTSDYAFVFVNDLGITYTARQTTSAVKI